MPHLLALAAVHRPDSSNAQLLARAVAHARAAGAQVQSHHLPEFPLPLFADERVELPQAGKDFLTALEAADGLLIASPEHNWSFPAALKNLIDWLSCLRPQPFAGKHALLLSASPSRRGGLQGLLQLRVPLESLHMHIYPRYFALGEAQHHLTPEGLVPPVLDQELQAIVTGFLRLLPSA